VKDSVVDLAFWRGLVLLWVSEWHLLVNGRKKDRSQDLKKEAETTDIVNTTSI
jgi:hypothetical protein